VCMCVCVCVSIPLSLFIDVKSGQPALRVAVSNAGNTTHLLRDVRRELELLRPGLATFTTHACRFVFCLYGMRVLLCACFYVCVDACICVYAFSLYLSLSLSLSHTHTHTRSLARSLSLSLSLSLSRPNLRGRRHVCVCVHTYILNI
jgi:hypothetical protein